MLIYTDLAHEIIADIARTVDELGHLQPDAVAVMAAPRWAGSSCGHLGKCYALGGRDAPSFTVWVRGRRGRRIIEVSEWYRVEPVEIDFHGRRCLYLIELHLPRMLDHDPLETLVHELFHIGESFDGSLRPLRHGKMFDWRVRRIIQEWQRRGDPRLVTMARASLGELLNTHGAVLGRRPPRGFRASLVVPAEAPQPYEDALPHHYPGYRLEAAYGIQPAPLTPRVVPRRVERKDCSLHSYHADGSTAVPPPLARYLARAHAPESVS